MRYLIFQEFTKNLSNSFKIQMYCRKALNIYRQQIAVTIIDVTLTFDKKSFQITFKNNTLPLLLNRKS